LSPGGPGDAWGLVTLLRSGMGTWIQAWLARPIPSGAGLLDHRAEVLDAAERDWVLALAALAFGQRDGQAVRHG
jgi:hypothetical protein